MADPKAEYTSVAEMVRSVSDDPQFADEFDRRVNSRRLVKHLFALRSAEGLSQKDIADRIGCSQSRISKLESGNDDDLRLADLAAYLRALGLDLCAQVRQMLGAMHVEVHRVQPPHTSGTARAARCSTR